MLISVPITLTGLMAPIIISGCVTLAQNAQLDSWTIAKGVTFRFKLTKEKILWENLTPQSGFSL